MNVLYLSSYVCSVLVHYQNNSSVQSVCVCVFAIFLSGCDDNTAGQSVCIIVLCMFFILSPTVTVASTVIVPLYKLLPLLQNNMNLCNPKV